MDPSDKPESLSKHLQEFDRRNAEIADWRRIQPRAVPGLNSMEDYKTRVAVGRGLAHNYLADLGCMNPKPEMMLEAHRRMFAVATTDGVVRFPSTFSIIFGTPPSIIATAEFVVPKSIPIILLIIFLY